MPRVLVLMLEHQRACASSIYANENEVMITLRRVCDKPYRVEPRGNKRSSLATSMSIEYAKEVSGRAATRVTVK